MAIDSQWDNVSLLLPLSADLLDARGHVTTASGGSALSSAVGNPFGAGNALYCDGTNDRLIATSADFTLGTGDFSIQFWFYSVDGGHGANYGRLLTIGPGATTGGLYVVSSLNYNPMQVIIQSYASGAYNDVIDPVATTLSDDTWHFAQLDRVSGVFNFYVDNVLYDTKTVSRDLTRTELSLGANPDGTEAFKGYFSNVRITKAAYRTDHSIPSAPFVRPTIKGIVLDGAAAPIARTISVRDRSTNLSLGGVNSDPTTGEYTFYPPDFGEVQVVRLDALCDPNFDRIVFLSRLNAAGFPTLTGQTLTATGTVTASTAVADPFAGATASALFTGVGSYLMASGSISLGTKYSISVWFRVTSLAAFQGLVFVGAYGANASRVQLSVDTTGALDFFSTDSTSSVVFACLSPAGACVVNTWYHFEAVRDGANVLGFLNGVLVFTVKASGTGSVGNALYLGYSRSSNTNRGLDGRLFDLKVSTSVDHYYAFSPPTALSLGLLPDGGSGENALIYDRGIPGG